MPEDAETLSDLLKRAFVRLGEIESNQKDRDRSSRRWKASGLAVALVIALALGYVGVGFRDEAKTNRENTAAIRENSEAIKINDQQLTAICVRDRTDLRGAVTAVANKLVDAGLASASTLEERAQVESFRAQLIRDFTAGTADPKDCA